MVATVTLDFDQVARRAKVKLETAFHEVTQDIAEAMVLATPVDTGNLRASWFASINSPGDIPDAIAPDKEGALTVGRVNLEISQSKVGDVLYFLNGANYAYFVEYGTSKMAPRMFVRGTLNSAPQIASRTIQRIART